MYVLIGTVVPLCVLKQGSARTSIPKPPASVQVKSLTKAQTWRRCTVASPKRAHLLA